ncbi:Bgt-1374 [Blumeria graminis f. sp. tritici]|uniref:RNA helicase n=2 Tax=Blumeria graminis f. sp. tritici TaxID=62690 RepID=A0A9X9MMF8_BLUGR|nr:helicase [Blumeria graminis f. sp. tritici 96224]VDB93343.1 Bgt-1374 [Blumeria graminis f. sp. tritici]
MAAGKKKKKIASNPARGFTTVSIASKPKAEAPELETLSSPSKELVQAHTSGAEKTAIGELAPNIESEKTIGAEEFEKQLEESELQLIVEKYAQKSRKDVQRQRARLETDRRVLRSQSEAFHNKQWLPKEVVEEILDLLKAEKRISGQGDKVISNKQPTDEDLTIRLWKLQQVLAEAGFSEKNTFSALHYVLENSDKIGIGSRDIVWGLDESLDWLCLECPRDELPEYEIWNRKVGGAFKTSPVETGLDNQQTSKAPLPSLAPDTRHLKLTGSSCITPAKAKELSPVVKATKIDCESDIDPDDLLPIYLDCKKEIFKLQELKASNKHKSKRLGSRNSQLDKNTSKCSKSVKLMEKIKKIEDDILFDQYIAEQEWRKIRIQIEKEAAAEASRLAKDSLERSDCTSQQSQFLDAQNLENNKNFDENSASKNENYKTANDNNGDDDKENSDENYDSILADLFDNQPLTQADQSPNETSTAINNNSSTTVIIREFGEWSGVSPGKILEETCRHRDPAVKIKLTPTLKTYFSNRHSLKITWSKPPQLESNPPAAIKYTLSSESETFTMVKISTPTSAESEAYIATTALFSLYASSNMKEKVFLRLPSIWKDLWNEFAAEKKECADQEDRDTIRVFRNMVREKRDRELEDGVLLQGAFKNRIASRPGDEESCSSRSQKLAPESYYRTWYEKSSTMNYQIMLQSRMKLPIWGFKSKLLDTIDREQVVIICGETGCGKSTQVPSFILENQLCQGKACKIYVTEPRRISAISLARRVSEELGESKNDLGTPRSLVGYAIRLESSISKETQLIYATTGIVMRLLEASNTLKEVTHIILDEVHERIIDSDFLLIVLRKLLEKRPDLKIVLMSATVDAERFSKYFNGAPILNIPGRTFPVQVKFLEDAIELTGYSPENEYQEKFTDIDELDVPDPIFGDSSKSENSKALRGYSNNTRNTIMQLDEYRIDYELITQLLAKIATEKRLEVFSKAILVFLPGLAEIRQLYDILMGHATFSSNWDIFLLHSTIASEDQEAAFLLPQQGMRKIILATNIAETGITIPDVTCVIDTGKHREMRFDERRQLSRLIETFISKANAKQRRGRAGRVQEGLCFHLFTKYRHDNLMADHQTPELLRLSLQDLAIRVKICKLGSIEETLGQALDPPLPKNIRRAIDALIDVRALTSCEDLTPLGVQLARLPLDVFLGKLILLGCIFKCLDATTTIAAILSSKSPFSAPYGARSQADNARLAYRRGDSDLLTIYNAYLAWKRVCVSGASEYQFCKKHFLSPQTLANIEDLKGQLTVYLVDSGFLPLTDAERSSLNRARYSSRRRQFFDLPRRSTINSENDLITSSVIAWSFYPKLLIRDGKGFRNCANNQSISLHPSSVNKGNNDLKWLSYYHIMQAKQFYNAHETTGTEDFAVALLCGDARCDVYAGVIVLDGNRARFSLPDWKTMLAMKTLRARLREILTRSFKNPGKPLSVQQQKWMEIWQKIFTQEPINKA